MTKEQLFANPNYQRLSKKRRNVAILVLLEGTTFAAACKSQKLNQSREAKNQLLQWVLAGDTDMHIQDDAPAAEPGSTNSHLYDAARRIGELLGDQKTAAYPGCPATMPTHPDSFLAKELGVYELPLHPMPLDPARLAKYREYAARYIDAVRNPEPWFCPCSPDAKVPQAPDAYICHRCGRHNPATEAKHAANPYA